MFVLKDGYIYENKKIGSCDINQLIGNEKQYSLTESTNQKIYQWQMFDLEKGCYENDLTNTTLIEGVTPIEGKVIIDKIEDVKDVKVQDLENKCNEVLNNGFASNCLGATRKFSSTDLNRSLIIGLVSKAQLLLNNVDLPDKNLDWKAEDDPVCYAWTPQQILVLGSDLSTFMTSTIKHKELLQAYVKTLTTVEEVNKVTWDTVIPTTTT